MSRARQLAERNQRIGDGMNDGIPRYEGEDVSPLIDEINKMKAEILQLRGITKVIKEANEELEEDGDEDVGLLTVGPNEEPRSFECYINADGYLIRRAGWRCVTDGEWEEVAERSCGSAEGDQQPWMEWRHTQFDSEGAQVAGTGAWYEGDSDPPAQSSANMVFIFCKVVDSSGVLFINHRHLGDVRAFDIRDC
jgi:hypothetical protein